MVLIKPNMVCLLTGLPRARFHARPDVYGLTVHKSAKGYASYDLDEVMALIKRDGFDKLYQKRKR